VTAKKKRTGKSAGATRAKDARVGKSRTPLKRRGPKPVDPRRREYLDNRARGDSKKDAATKAGFSASMARNAKEKIEKPIAGELARAIQARIPIEKIVQRIDEGLDAVETKVISHLGTVTDYIDLVAWTERREYAAMAAEYGRYHEPRKKFGFEGDFPDGCKVTVEFIGEPPTGEPAGARR
jgi:hypothetical protein